MKSFAGRIVLALLILALAWGVIQVTSYVRLQYSLNAKIRNLRADGYPVSISDLERSDLSKSQAISEIIAMKPMLDKLEQLLLAISPPQNTSQEAAIAEHTVFQAFLIEHPGMIQAIRDAGARPIGRSWCDFSSPPSLFLQSSFDQMGNYQSAVRALAMDAEIQLSVDDPNEAARDAIAIMQWGDHAAAEPGLAFYLKSLAIRSKGMSLAAGALDSDSLSIELRKTLLQMIRDHDSVGAWSASLASERAIGISLVGEFGPTRHMPMLVRDRRLYLDIIEEYQAAAAEPWGMKRTSTMNTAGVLTGLVEKSIESAFQSFRGNQAQANTILILNAWQEAGRPTPIDFATLSVDAARLVDPFVGKPIRVKVDEENVTFYSVGSNQRDDHGEVSDEIDIGFSASIVK